MSGPHRVYSLNLSFSRASRESNRIFSSHSRGLSACRSREYSTTGAGTEITESESSPGILSTLGSHYYCWDRGWEYSRFSSRIFRRSSPFSFPDYSGLSISASSDYTKSRIKKNCRSKNCFLNFPYSCYRLLFLENKKRVGGGGGKWQ